MKKQSKADKMHESKAMKMVMEKKSVAKKDEAAAGREYNKSEKHRKAQSLGMKKAMKRK